MDGIEDQGTQTAFDGSREGTEKGTLKVANISALVRDKKFQVRRRLDQGAIARYTSAYKAGVDLPPIKVAIVGGVPFVVDGWHRLAALDRLGREMADVLVIETSRELAAWMAAEANLAHGLPLKGREYRNAFRAYVRAGKYRKGKHGLKSYREIGRELGKTHPTVRTWMMKDFPKIAATYEADGEEPPLTGGLIEADPMQELLGSFQQKLNEAVALSRGAKDEDTRRQIVEALERTLDCVRRAEPPEMPDFWEPNDDF